MTPEIRFVILLLSGVTAIIDFAMGWYILGSFMTAVTGLNYYLYKEGK